MNATHNASKKTFVLKDEFLQSDWGYYTGKFAGLGFDHGRVYVVLDANPYGTHNLTFRGIVSEFLRSMRSLHYLDTDTSDKSIRSRISKFKMWDDIRQTSLEALHQELPKLTLTPSVLADLKDAAAAFKDVAHVISIVGDHGYEGDFNAALQALVKVTESAPASLQTTKPRTLTKS